MYVWNRTAVVYLQDKNRLVILRVTSYRFLCGRKSYLVISHTIFWWCCG